MDQVPLALNSFEHLNVNEMLLANNGGKMVFFRRKMMFLLSQEHRLKG